MMKRILVTGSNGFTGKYVCSELKKFGYEVYGLTKNFNIADQSIDLRDRSALEDLISTVRPQGVVHLAAIASVTHGCDSDFVDVNVNGTRNLLDSLSCLTCLKSIIVASSANIYGNLGFGCAITEDMAPNPQNFYAESKLRMEDCIKRDYGGLPITIVRPFNYTGVGQANNFLIPKIVSAFKRKAKILHLGNLDVYRDFSDVRFVSWAYAKLIDECSKGDLINLCSGAAYSIGNVIKICSKLMQYKLEIKSDLKLRRDNELLYLCGDPTHMVQVLGKKSPFSLEDTLSWMLFT